MGARTPTPWLQTDLTYQRFREDGRLFIDGTRGRRHQITRGRIVGKQATIATDLYRLIFDIFPISGTL